MAMYGLEPIELQDCEHHLALTYAMVFGQTGAACFPVWKREKPIQVLDSYKEIIESTRTDLKLTP